MSREPLRVCKGFPAYTISSFVVGAAAKFQHIESDTSIADSELSDHTGAQLIHNASHKCINDLEDPSYFLEHDVSYTSSVDDPIEGFNPDLSTQPTSSAEQPPTPTPQPTWADKFSDLGNGTSRLLPPSPSAHMRKAEYCSPTERTIALLNERARLLGELADLCRARKASR
ncbi:hypothetical protein K503DRAFT_802540 [Rhizopogon vinicolor AM-OR11-026]|uniref:Uncharacterized protein n=1 Tax=Rhizopogon vinicolor AM-OR11-026 TaxID=1314800 RepID=A0A1B7MT35_9AGAM|nr:hypothetical protein K503DRAFT_802540 [Rhizopogon vinicolor AM-OR11-026]